MIVDNGFGYRINTKTAALYSSDGFRRILLMRDDSVPDIKNMIGLDILKREPEPRDSRKIDIRILRPITNKQANFLIDTYVIYGNIKIMYDFSYLFIYTKNRPKSHPTYRGVIEYVDYNFFTKNVEMDYYLSDKAPTGFDRSGHKLICFPKLKMP